jgi:hypothetical protein
VELTFGQEKMPWNNQKNSTHVDVVTQLLPHAVVATQLETGAQFVSGPPALLHPAREGPLLFDEKPINDSNMGHNKQ